VGNAASHGPIQLNRRLIAGGGVLIGLGGLLGFAGMLLVSSAIVPAARRRVNQLEQPPSELAKRTPELGRPIAAPLERHLRPEVYRRRRGGCLDRRHAPAAAAAPTRAAVAGVPGPATSPWTSPLDQA
jgi:hypothetical protein